jgi:alpha-1,2-mannosyltransferase
MGVIPLTFRLRPTYQDFPTFYVAGVVARLGEWSALYPVVDNDSSFRFGDSGTRKPRLVQLGAERHMPDSLPFLYPPPAAVLLSPLGLLSFPAAYWVWVILMCSSGWAVAMLGGRVYALCAGRDSRMQGVVVLLAAFSLLTYRAIRVQNVSALVGLCLILSVLSFMGQFKIGPIGRSAVGPPALGLSTGLLAGGLALVVAGLKFTSAPLVALAVAMRQWRTLVVAAIVTIVLVLATYRVAGRGTFEEYFARVAPTFGASTNAVGNKSLQGFLLRVMGGSPLPPGVRYACLALQGASLGGLLWLIFRQPYTAWREPPRVFAASAALIGWMLIFSPLCWEHYFIYLCPLWGWLIWEASQGPWKRIAAWAAVAALWSPLPDNQWLKIPEPVNSYMLWALLVTCALAVARINVSARTQAS